MADRFADRVEEFGGRIVVAIKVGLPWAHDINLVDPGGNEGQRLGYDL